MSLSLKTIAEVCFGRPITTEVFESFVNTVPETGKHFFIYAQSYRAHICPIAVDTYDTMIHSKFGSVANRGLTFRSDKVPDHLS